MRLLHHVFAMRRSGHHGVINWLRAAYVDAGWEVKAFDSHNHRMRLRPRAFRHVRGIASRFARRRRSDDNFALFIDWEDPWMTEMLPRLRQRLPKKPWRAFTHKLWLVVRDPFNCLASLYKIKGEIDWEPHMWLEHANVAEPDVGLILFDRWSRDPDYRYELADRFGVPFSDRGINWLGSKSSFDQRGYRGNASQMRVTERWRHFQDDETFKAFFTPEIIEAAERLFGESLPARALGLLPSTDP